MIYLFKMVDLSMAMLVITRWYLFKNNDPIERIWNSLNVCERIKNDQETSTNEILRYLDLRFVDDFHIFKQWEIHIRNGQSRKRILFFNIWGRSWNESMKLSYPLVNIQKTMENHNVLWVNQLLPEGSVAMDSYGIAGPSPMIYGTY